MMSNPPHHQDRFHAIAGCLHGTAVGDAIGLPFEGLSRRRVNRWLRSPLQHRFFFGHGFCSDDTEHTCMVAQALLTARTETDQKWFLAVFTHNLAWRFRAWLLGLPAGIGLATLRAIAKQWLHLLSHSNGVFSAGNGPAMRSAILGVCHGDDPAFLRQLVRASTHLTHTDPRAEHGALAVAWAARSASRGVAESPAEFIQSFAALLGNEESALLAALKWAAQSASNGESTLDYATRIGCGNGVSGFVMHTVPVALHAWWSYPTNYAAALETAVRCGGDTDTVGAIVGGVVGAQVGPDGVPAPWRERLWEWPRSSRWIDQLAQRLAVTADAPERNGALPLNIPALLVRNLLFMVWVLVHGFRRMLPPY